MKLALCMIITTMLAIGPARAKDVTQSVNLPKSSEAAGQHNPPCSTKVDAKKGGG